jgi:hypothetical protein
LFAKEALKIKKLFKFFYPLVIAERNTVRRRSQPEPFRAKKAAKLQQKHFGELK